MMDWLAPALNHAINEYQALGAINEFMYRGGPVLWWLSALVALFWVLTLERLWYLWMVFPKKQHDWVLQWQDRDDRYSWYARAQRTLLLDQAQRGLSQHLPLLKLIVTLFPMLGLLGTVTGMISVFDIMANQGSAQPRLMAAGISMATLPTMAGMVAALTGMFVYSRLNAACQKRNLHLERLMRTKSNTATSLGESK